MFRAFKRWWTGSGKADVCPCLRCQLRRAIEQQVKQAQEQAQEQAEHHAREAQREHRGQRVPPTGGSSTAPPTPQPTDWSDCEVGLKPEAGEVVLYLVSHGKWMRIRLDPTLAWKLGEELQRQAPVARDQARDAAVAESAREDGHP